MATTSTPDGPTTLTFEFPVTVEVDADQLPEGFDLTVAGYYTREALKEAVNANLGRFVAGGKQARVSVHAKADSPDVQIVTYTADDPS